MIILNLFNLKLISVVAILWLSLSAVAEPLSSSALAEVAGRTLVLYTHPQSLAQPVSGRLWAGTERGGLWKSEDNGKSWQAGSDLMQGLSVTSVVVDPRNSDIMYAGTGLGSDVALRERGIFKSEDGGKSWSLLALTNPAVVGANWSQVHHIAISTSGVLLVATADKERNGFIYRSADGGENWGLFPVYVGSKIGPRNTIHKVKFDPDNPEGAIFMDNYANITLSADGGRTWSLVRKSTTCK
jgi:photosystem II stability/assembly factor-like uncharacterized protein